MNWKVLAAVALCFGFLSVRAEASGGVRASFEGRYDPQTGRLTVRVADSGGQLFSLDARRTAPGKVKILADMRHWGVEGLDVSSMLQAEVVSRSGDFLQGDISGRVESRMTLVNYRPVRDFLLQFEVRDRLFRIDKFWMGSLLVFGSISLDRSHQVDLNCEMFSTSLEALTDPLRDRRLYAIPAVSGTLSARLMLSGDWSHPQMKGRLAVYDGQFRATAFESIEAQFSGQYPQLVLEQVSVIPAAAPPFRLAGRLDLAGPEMISDQLAVLPRVPEIVDRKDSRSWVFKRLRSDRDSVTEMKYFLMKDDRGDTSAVLGVQKSIGF